MQTSVRPQLLIWAALGLTLAAAVCFSRGWLAAGLAALLISTPLDTIASRLASIRLRPLAVRLYSRLALWPAAGIALLALGWWEMHAGKGWGALLSAVVTIAFAEAARIEKGGYSGDGDIWLFSRRNAIFAAIPFAIAGSWTAYLVGTGLYAAVSFFILQRVRHRPNPSPELTRS
jgi:hypothetical protein